MILLMGVGSWYGLGWADRMMAEEEGLTVKEFQDKREKESRERKEKHPHLDRLINALILSAAVFGFYLVWHYILVPLIVFIGKQ